ncbi:MAG TPA: hypothetical protein VFP76_05480 [Gemmatimonadota bacterium]|nr:hypothetical protein [Gemmatimonadota bacterium]
MKIDADYPRLGRTLALRVRKITCLLLVGVLLIVVANVVAGLVQMVTGQPVPNIVDVAREVNLPTWYSSILLILAAALAALAGKSEKMVGGPHILHWWGLALVMALISIDEMLTFHEWGDELVPGWMTRPFGEWIQVHPWVLLGLPLVALFVILYLPFVSDLPARTRRWIVAGGAVYVAGALGGESLHGVINTYHGGGVFTSLAVLLEETLEMVGIVVFIHGLLTHLTGRDAAFSLELRG